MQTDLAIDHELGFALMNLVAIEEHLAMTLAKTQDPRHLALYHEIRRLRAKHLKTLFPHPAGELWCAAKHLLAASMRFLETGVKYGAAGREKRAMGCFRDALLLYAYFWALQKEAQK